MDSKHRHELEQNELAKWIIAQYEDWIRPNSGWLGYVLLGVLIVVAIVIITARVNTWNRVAAWKQYYAALHSEQPETELEIIADTTSGIVGIQARLTLAQRQLSEGCTQVFIDKAQSITLLEKAITSFQRVQKATNDSLVLQQAGFGLGQCWEALAAARVGDDLIKAEEEYHKIVERWGEGFTGQRAKKQLALIQQPTTRTFFQLAAARTATSSEMEDFTVNPFDITTPFTPGQIDVDGVFDQKMETEVEEEKNNEVEREPKPENGEKTPETPSPLPTEES